MQTTERIVDISNEPARLSVRLKQLVIKRGDEETTLPLAELAVIVVSHPAVTYTHAVLTGICSAGGAFVVCDEKHLPTGMLLSLQGHFVQTERFAAQAQAPAPMKKQVWKQIVRSKVLAQAALLGRLRGEDHGLSRLAANVRSGDTANIEAQASRRYWPALFGPEFGRNHEAEDHNKLLNYGYAVLRASTARALCAAGLHPSLGVHHHNRYDPFCLADDLMEPFRPLVDGLVFEVVEEKGSQALLDKETKAALIGGLMQSRLTMDDESRALFDVLARSASSMAAVFAGKRKNLSLPDF
jgi:CRISPR-associated protein Cas1